MIVKRSYVVIFSSLLLLSVGAMAQDSDVMTKHSDWDENINIKNIKEIKCHNSNKKIYNKFDGL